ncbi:hypothetical protein J6590_014946 [Homalodisca vitripennis]|nr:hypothetical protein J6590_014946 [Homalodisca vitripennis]
MRLWTHRKYECGKGHQFQCHVCSKRYTRKESLIQHSLMLHNVMPTNLKYECGKGPQFQCQVCSKRYTRKESLIQHSLMLHNVMPTNL